MFGRAIVRKILNRFVELGIQSQKGAKHNQITRLINKICLFGILIITPHMIITIYFGTMIVSIVQLTTIILLALLIYLNSLYYFNLVRVAAILVGNFHICGVILLLGIDRGVYYYFAFTIIAPLFFYTGKEKRYIFGFVSLSILLTISTQILSSIYGPIIKAPSALLEVLLYLSVIGALGVIFIFVYHFYSESNRFEKSLEQANLQLQKLSDTDPLTRLPNRRSFNKNLEREWGKGIRNKTPCAIIMIDIDLFKVFNDLYGHQAGDVCLEQVSEVIADNTREFLDFPARYGGEEFIILLTNTSLEEALIIAERIREEVFNLAIPHELNKKIGVVTCSLGVACSRVRKDSDPQELIRIADEALYLAKENGRNRIEGSR